jgi:RNA polymerase sigma-70 factor (ECF subfamily)
LGKKNVNATATIWPGDGNIFPAGSKGSLRWQVLPWLRLAFRALSDKFNCMLAEEINWPEALCAADNAVAVAGLRAVLLNGLRVALRDRNDVSDAHLEDFAQEGLLRVLDRLDQFQGRSKFTTWAHTIALNTAFTELRRKRWRDVSLDEFMADGRHFAESVTADAVPGADAERERLVGVLRKTVAEKLSEKQRAAIAASLDGLPFDQIVTLLGTNRNAAYKLVHDARRALKSALAAEGVSAETIRTAFAP